jgi:hypothetical protein
MRGLRVRKSAFTIQSFGLKRQLPLRDRIPSERAAGALSYDSELIAHTCKRVAPNRLAPVAPPFAFESSITPPPNRPELGDTERSNFDLTKQYESRPVLNHARYDTTNQLTSEHRSGANAYVHTFIYDGVGNRLVKIEDGVRTTYSYDAANQIVYVAQLN